MLSQRRRAIPSSKHTGGGIRRVVLAPFLPVLLGGSRPEDALADADDALADADDALADAEPLEEPAVGRALKNSDAMIN